MQSNEVVSIILAAGRGSRMNRPDRNKVCFEVLGVPAIVRSLQAYTSAGVDRHVVVVGDLREEVERCLADQLYRVVYARQPEPLGTGHAARCGAAVLRMFDWQGLVLIAAGDKIVEPDAVRRLLAAQAETDADLALLVTPSEFNPDGGRVISHADGTLAAIVEARDMRAAGLVERLLERVSSLADGPALTVPLQELIESHMQPARVPAALGPVHPLIYGRDTADRDKLIAALRTLLEERSLVLRTESGPQRVSLAQAEALTNQCNASVYLFKAPALYHGLDRITRANVQGEEYITDIVKILSDPGDAAPEAVSAYRVIAVDTQAPTDVQGFNTLEELYAIEDFLRRRETAPALSAGCFRPVREWQELLAEDSPLVAVALTAYYGDDQTLHRRKREQYLCALDLYARQFSPEDRAVIVRSPGRLNLMGRHIDHRGGRTNVIAISDEVVFVAAPRDDDRIELRNTGEQFVDSGFSIGGEMSQLDWGDWIVCVNSPQTLRLLKGSEGDWAHYVRAAIFRLQSHFGDRKLRGMNVAVCGSVPVGSGLSSSSAVVVATGDAAIALNNLPVQPEELVDLCGEGEWFVGTRGGKGDHAAIKLGRRNLVAHVEFMPFETKEYLPFFEGHSLVVCNSGQQARKSEGAKKTFNEKILGYTTGEVLLCKRFPQYAPKIKHLRDINCETLGIELHELYWMLLQVPERITRQELLSLGPFTPEQNKRLQSLFGAATRATGADEPYDVRGVVLFGLAECERSKLCLQYLRAGDADRFGELWYLSHDGDRLVAHDANLGQLLFDYDVSDQYLHTLIGDAQSDDPSRTERALLYRQPGQYRCSTETIDRLVDMARRHPGVKGAQLAGAGLGGCIIVLVETQHAEDLIAMYAESGFQAARYIPVEGAGLVEVGR
jgi:N-acetylgalactosamine kinase